MPTMHQVAAQAGVSPSTVSYVLSGLRPVSEVTRAKVDAAIAELGYIPNAAARTLALQRTKVIAMVYPMLDTDLSTTVQSFIISASATARKYDYDLVLWPFENDAAEQIVSLAKRGMADGILVMEIGLNDSRIAALHKAHIPFAMIGRTDDAVAHPWVDVDFAATMKLAVNKLTGLGHQHIAFLNRSESAAQTGYAPIFRMEQAFNAEMHSAGLQPIIYRCDENPIAGADAATKLLADNPEITAFILMNEVATLGFLEEIRRCGLSIPTDISVMSVLSSPEVARMTNPQLYSLGVPGQELGHKAALTLLAKLGVTAPKVIQPLVPCQEIPGNSLAPARRGVVAGSNKDSIPGSIK